VTPQRLARVTAAVALAVAGLAAAAWLAALVYGALVLVGVVR